MPKRGPVINFAAHIYIYALDGFGAHLFSLFGFKWLVLWVSGWSFGFLLERVLGIEGLKLELGTGWFEACAFFLLSSCSFLLGSQITWFLFLLPLVILCPWSSCSFVFLFLTAFVIWANGELWVWMCEGIIVLYGFVFKGVLGIGGLKGYLVSLVILFLFLLVPHFLSDMS